MQTTIRKWGNSASVRIPVAMLESTQLRVDDVIDMREEDGRIILEPVRVPAYNLADLLAGITPENCHAEADFGPGVGQEIF